MKDMKEITYPLIIKRYFPDTHPAAGEPTNFIPNMMAKVKKHTIRGNYEYWKMVVEEVQAGKAIISVRVVVNQKYGNKKAHLVEELQFRQGDPIGVEKLIVTDSLYTVVPEDSHYQCTSIPLKTLAINEGLKPLDFMDWFDPPQQEPYAIIHFTDLRYAREYTGG